MLKREAVLSFRLRSYAIRGNRYFEIPHIRVIRRVEDANVGGESCENRTLDLESLQEHFKGGGEETRVHRLEDKVIILGGSEEFDDLAALATFLQTTQFADESRNAIGQNYRLRKWWESAPAWRVPLTRQCVRRRAKRAEVALLPWESQSR
jgi:hypothetical protein